MIVPAGPYNLPVISEPGTVNKKAPQRESSIYKAKLFQQAKPEEFVELCLHRELEKVFPYLDLLFINNTKSSE